MSVPASQLRTLTIFCKVVDNFGDIGICWRLAKQLRREHELDVSLRVDDLRSFRRICPQVDAEAARQHIDGITVLHWKNQEGRFTPDDVADIVIEFFGCDIPPSYIEAMSRRDPRPVWLNLEGLTTEEWVEGCHRLPSPHPRLPLTKHFFFPGFTDRTGGLLHEDDLEEQRFRFQSAPGAQSAFLAELGLTAAEIASQKVSLFCYSYAPAAALFDAWERGNAPLTCLVPEGVAADAARAFLEADPVAGAMRTRGALTVRILPFVAQPDYDRLLWACDVNFVRGEDSFVRAQWAGKPFVWHIYAQDENLHHKKLRAFLQRYAPGLEDFAAMSLVWNGVQDGDWQALWKGFVAEAPKIAARAEDWRREVLAIGDFASNMMAFARQLQSGNTENTV
ncbi:elongation factor P maturation arginine rhamnosyltransferase EarP [Oxalobacteraceae bacterium OM1]|nr:elongation factor P maturation arginine rhamnosyltransferase EarP [Oxalobacteraceae bacterium OM1]